MLRMSIYEKLSEIFESLATSTPENIRNEIIPILLDKKLDEIREEAVRIRNASTKENIWDLLIKQSLNSEPKPTEQLIPEEKIKEINIEIQQHTTSKLIIDALSIKIEEMLRWDRDDSLNEIKKEIEKFLNITKIQKWSKDFSIAFVDFVMDCYKKNVINKAEVRKYLLNDLLSAEVLEYAGNQLFITIGLTTEEIVYEKKESKSILDKMKKAEQLDNYLLPLFFYILSGKTVKNKLAIYALLMNINSESGLDNIHKLEDFKSKDIVNLLAKPFIKDLELFAETNANAAIELSRMYLLAWQNNYQQSLYLAKAIEYDRKSLLLNGSSSDLTTLLNQEMQKLKSEEKREQKSEVKELDIRINDIIPTVSSEMKESSSITRFIALQIAVQKVFTSALTGNKEAIETVLNPFFKEKSVGIEQEVLSQWFYKFCQFPKIQSDLPKILKNLSKELQGNILNLYLTAHFAQKPIVDFTQEEKWLFTLFKDENIRSHLDGPNLIAFLEFCFERKKIKVGWYEEKDALSHFGVNSSNFFTEILTDKNVLSQLVEKYSHKFILKLILADVAIEADKKTNQQIISIVIEEMNELLNGKVEERQQDFLTLLFFVFQKIENGILSMSEFVSKLSIINKNLGLEWQVEKLNKQKPMYLSQYSDYICKMLEQKKIAVDSVAAIMDIYFHRSRFPANVELDIESLCLKRYDELSYSSRFNLFKKIIGTTIHAHSQGCDESRYLEQHEKPERTKERIIFLAFILKNNDFVFDIETEIFRIAGKDPFYPPYFKNSPEEIFNAIVDIRKQYPKLELEKELTIIENLFRSAYNLESSDISATEVEKLKKAFFNYPSPFQLISLPLPKEEKRALQSSLKSESFYPVINTSKHFLSWLSNKEQALRVLRNMPEKVKNELQAELANTLKNRLDNLKKNDERVELLTATLKLDSRSTPLLRYINSKWIKNECVKTYDSITSELKSIHDKLSDQESSFNAFEKIVTMIIQREDCQYGMDSIQESDIRYSRNEFVDRFLNSILAAIKKNDSEKINGLLKERNFPCTEIQNLIKLFDKLIPHNSEQKQVAKVSP